MLCTEEPGRKLWLLYGAHYRVSMREGWEKMRADQWAFLLAPGVTPPSEEAMDHALSARDPQYEQGVTIVLEDWPVLLCEPETPNVPVQAPATVARISLLAVEPEAELVLPDGSPEPEDEPDGGEVYEGDDTALDNDVDELEGW